MRKRRVDLNLELLEGRVVLSNIISVTTADGLSAAIAAAAASPGSEIQLATPDVDVDGQVTLPNDTTLDGQGNTLVLSSAEAGFNVTSGSTATLENLQITAGSLTELDASVFTETNATVTISQVYINLNNVPIVTDSPPISLQGGFVTINTLDLNKVDSAVSVFSINQTNPSNIGTSSSATIEAMTIENSTAGSSGASYGSPVFGADTSAKSSLTISDSTFSNNTSYGNAAVTITGIAGAPAITLTGTSITNNTASGGVGGLEVYSGSVVNTTGINVSGNTPSNTGGGGTITGLPSTTSPVVTTTAPTSTPTPTAAAVVSLDVSTRHVTKIKLHQAGGVNTLAITATTGVAHPTRRLMDTVVVPESLIIRETIGKRVSQLDLSAGQELVVTYSAKQATKLGKLVSLFA